MLTKTVFEASLSAVVTLTGTDDFASGAFPVAVNFDDDTKFVVNCTLSKEIVEPGLNPAPLTVSVKLPVITGDGLTEVMFACGMTVTAAVPLDAGDTALVARIVTTGGDGTTVGGKYCPLVLIDPTTVSPPVMPLTLQVTPPDAPVTTAVND